MTVDELLKRSGDFGPAQIWLLSLFCVVNLLSAFHYFAQTFICLSLKNCSLGLTDQNITQGDNRSLELFVPSDLNSRFYALTSEMGWTCNEGWKMALVQSMFFIGSVLGTLTLGISADHVGRRPVLFASNVFAIAGNILTVFVSPALWSLSFSRFIAGLATDTNFFMMYIIVMEYMKPEFRTFGLNLCIGVWYCVGCMAIPWIALYTGSWRTFLIVISLPMLMVPVSSCFIPESAQWLMSKGKPDRAIKCFKKIARFNGRELSQEFVDQFNLVAAPYATENKKSNLFGLFQTPRLRKNTCILIFKGMVLTLCYDAMSRNINGLNMDPFLLFTITSASIFPSCLVVLIFQDRIGRKAMAVFSLFFTGILNFAQGIHHLLGKNEAYIGTVIGLLGRFSVNIAYNSGTQYAAELIPTEVRGQGLAMIHMVGNGAAFFSPYILFLSSKWIAAPETVLSLLSFVGAAFCVLLPETMNKSIPVTLEDGESFADDEQPWDFLWKKRKFQLSYMSKSLTS